MKSHVITLAAGVSVGFVLAKLLAGVPMFFKLTYRSKKNQSGTNTTNLQTARAPPGDYKLVIGARQDLQMGKGKIAAQCCHAAVACFEDAQESNENILEEWMDQGQRKIVVKVESEEQLEQLYEHAKTVGLITCVIEDAGKTQIAAGSKTVVGVGPGPASEIDKVMGHLKLY